MTDSPTEGWAWPTWARKYHYFVNGQSLCKHWTTHDIASARWLQPHRASRWEDDDCKACRAEIDRRLRDRLTKYLEVMSSSD